MIQYTPLSRTRVLQRHTTTPSGKHRAATFCIIPKTATNAAWIMDYGLRNVNRNPPNPGSLLIPKSSSPLQNPTSPKNLQPKNPKILNPTRDDRRLISAPLQLRAHVSWVAGPRKTSSPKNKKQGSF